MLEHFDYLSTVSGGGYIGAFFCSLFRGGRLRPFHPGPGVVDVEEAARNAYKVFQWEPPGRIHTRKAYDQEPVHVGEGPMAWLRENGRYLTPSGAGDVLYGVALAMRNWLSVHFVLGMPLLCMLTLLAMLRKLVGGLSGAAAMDPWADTLWWMPTAVVLLWMLPCIIAFWMVYSTRSTETDLPSLLNISLLSSIAIAVVLSAIVQPWDMRLAWPLGEWALIRPDNPTLLAALALVVICLTIVISFLAIYLPSKLARTVKGYRVRITRWLAYGIQLALLLSFLFIVDWVAQWAYRYGPGELSLTPAGLLAASIWVIRALVSFSNEKSWLASLLKLPLSRLAMLTGSFLAFLVAVCWGTLLQWLLAFEWDGLCRPSPSWTFLSSLVAFTAALTVLSGAFLGFINLSSLQALYSARLTRTFLGASNGYRFQSGGNMEERIARLSVSEALPHDDLTLEEYYGAKSKAPLHLINVTVNLTVDPAERLVQRDRKGLPLCIAPSTLQEVKGSEEQLDTYRFILDGVPQERGERHNTKSEIDQPLTVGHWIATSGAAFTTGLGRQTSWGTSLLLGLANVRLGTWWPANFLDSWTTPERTLQSKDPWYVKALRTQAYLLYELLARFHGHHRDYFYLSDGGHFENTGAYELLRPERGIRFILLCDCGADPRYEFDDLANLIRLARLDFGLEIEADNDFSYDSQYEELTKVIGHYTQTNHGDESNICPLKDDQFALLFNVFSGDGQGRTHKAMLLVIKPNRISHTNGDVWSYAKTHPSFPNEPTVDQFFDEAQFESYRQLGLNMGELLFGTGAENAPIRRTYEDKLWQYLESKLEKSTLDEP